MRFHLLDSITAWHPGVSARGLKACTRTQDQLPRTLLIESLAQLSSFLLGDAEARDGRKVLSLMVSVDRMAWHADLLPGERAVLEARILSRYPEGAKVEVTAAIGDRPLAEGRLGFVFFAADSPQQVRDFAWTYELLLVLSAGCADGVKPTRDVFR